MAIEAVKIPQNVYVEDRIIGPVTLKQLMITGAGAGLSYVLFASAQKSGVGNVVMLAACWIPAVIGAAFSFLKINDLTLFNIILLMIESANKPNIRYWSPHTGISINLITRQNVKQIDEASAKAATDVAKLSEITRQLEKRQQELNKLSAHDQPHAETTEGITTQIANGTKHGLYEHEETTEEQKIPVRQERVQAEGLEKTRSIDGISDAVKAYEQMFSPSHT